MSKEAWIGPHLPPEHWESKPAFDKWVKQPIKRHLAHEYGQILQKAGCEFIGITGSAGKTTAKEMTASVLRQKYSVRWTKENLDPVFNIPNTLLTTPLGTQKLVMEMGIEYPGEMDYYLWLVKPSIGVCTSVYWTHTKFFGDIDGVMKEKAKLISSLPENGEAILNYDDEKVRQMAKMTKAKVLWYSTLERLGINYWAENIGFTPDFKTRFKLHLGEDEREMVLPVFGEHFVSLALGAAAVGDISGISAEQICQGLTDFSPLSHRMTPIKLEDGRILIDDTYNANPSAVKEALKTVAKAGRERRRILVLGAMGELGEYEETGHREVGKYAMEMGFTMIVGYGEPVQTTLEEAIKDGLNKENARLFSSREEVVEFVNQIADKKDIILVKGSRAMEMEKVVESLRG